LNAAGVAFVMVTVLPAVIAVKLVVVRVIRFVVAELLIELTAYCVGSVPPGCGVAVLVSVIGYVPAGVG
jgi:hypothetical protein